MPDVISQAPADVRLWVALDVHKLSIVAGTLPPRGGEPDVQRIETTPKAIRRFIAKLGGPEGLAVGYEAGPGGFALWRLLSSMGVACDVIAPSLVPVRAGDRVKTDRRDAKKLVVLYRAGLLRFCQPPSVETEGLRDLLRCRDDIRCARTAARHRVVKQLARHHRIYREGTTTWTTKHRLWVKAQRLDDPLAQLALEQMIIHLEAIDTQLATLDAQLETIARQDRWAGQVQAAVPVPRDPHADRARVDRGDRRLQPLQPPRRARLVAGDRPVRVLLRRVPAPRAHHQDRQPPRSPAADRGRLALPPRPQAPPHGR